MCNSFQEFISSRNIFLSATYPWFTKCFRKVTLTISLLASDQTRLLKFRLELNKLITDGTVIIKSGIIERYSERVVSFSNESLNIIFLTEFAALYRQWKIFNQKSSRTMINLMCICTYRKIPVQSKPIEFIKGRSCKNRNGRTLNRMLMLF